MPAVLAQWPLLELLSLEHLRSALPQSPEVTGTRVAPGHRGLGLCVLSCRLGTTAGMQRFLAPQHCRKASCHLLSTGLCLMKLRSAVRIFFFFSFGQA